MRYGYARVSTRGQELSEQVAALKRAGADKVISEQVSGVVAAESRAKFRGMSARFAAGDELLVTKLDRLGRSGLDIQQTVESLRKRGVAVTVLGVGTIRDDLMGRLMLSMLSAFSDFERSMIVERMQEGRKAAMVAGKKMGRTFKLSPEARSAIVRRYHAGESGSALAAEYQIDRRTVTRLVGPRAA